MRTSRPERRNGEGGGRGGEGRGGEERRGRGERKGLDGMVGKCSPGPSTLRSPSRHAPPRLRAAKTDPDTLPPRTSPSAPLHPPPLSPQQSVGRAAPFSATDRAASIRLPIRVTSRRDMRYRRVRCAPRTGGSLAESSSLGRPSGRTCLPVSGPQYLTSRRRREHTPNSHTTPTSRQKLQR